MKKNKKSERISKVIARSTAYSRRQVEQLIYDGRVKIDNQTINRPGVNVSRENIIQLDKKHIPFNLIDEIYLFNKPKGCLVTHSDPKNRKTIFDFLPKKFEKIVTIGRLDYNSEGLIILTNNGDIKRNFELPKNNYERVYRVRVQGRINSRIIDKLKRGFYTKGIKYKPIIAKVESSSDTYCWLQMNLREGKNREIRNIFESLNMTVTRLIRISYGPYKLGKLQRGKFKKVSLIG